MTRAKIHPLSNLSGRLYDAGRLCSTLGLLAERGLGQPTPAQLEYIALLIGEVLEGLQAVLDPDGTP